MKWLTIVELLLGSTLVVDIPHKRSARTRLVSRTGDYHPYCNTISRHSVYLVVDELARAVEFGSSLTVLIEDVATLDSRPAINVRDYVTIRNSSSAEACNESQLSD